MGGKPNPVQPDLMRVQMMTMPEGSEIVAATDADDAGRQLAEVIRKAFDETARPDLTFRRQEPVEYKDWNDQLRARPRGPLPCWRREPSVA